MTCKKILLTKQVFTRKINRINEKYIDVTTPPKPPLKDGYLDKLKEQIEGNFIFCWVCDGEITKENIGEFIVCLKSTKYNKKWVHESCAKSKNMIE